MHGSIENPQAIPHHSRVMEKRIYDQTDYSRGSNFCSWTSGDESVSADPSKSAQDLDLEDGTAVQQWFSVHQPTVVVLAAAKVGGINANSSSPAVFF